jgi:hypothetical protein
MDGSRSMARAAVKSCWRRTGSAHRSATSASTQRSLDAHRFHDLEATLGNLALQLFQSMEERCREVVARGRVAMLAAPEILLEDALCRRIMGVASRPSA